MTGTSSVMMRPGTRASLCQPATRHLDRDTVDEVELLAELTASRLAQQLGCLALRPVPLTLGLPPCLGRAQLGLRGQLVRSLLSLLGQLLLVLELLVVLALDGLERRLGRLRLTALWTMIWNLSLGLACARSSRPGSTDVAGSEAATAGAVWPVTEPAPRDSMRTANIVTIAPRPPLPQRAFERCSPPRFPEPQSALLRTSPGLPPVFLPIVLPCPRQARAA